MTAIRLLAALMILTAVGPRNAHAAGYPSPPADFTPSPAVWSQFLNGDYRLQCKATGSSRRSFGKCQSGDCMCEPDTDQTLSLMAYRRISDWNGLARTMIYQQERSVGFLPADFFYVMLAQSAVGLGRKDSAVKYYRLARASRYTCLRYGPQNNGATCGGARDFQSGWIDFPLQQLEASIRDDERIQQQKLRAQVEEQRRKEEQARLEAEREKRIADLRSKYSEEWVQLILKREIAIGFSQEAVREALGEPSNIIKTPNGSEMWVYRNRRVIFKGGKVTFIE